MRTWLRPSFPKDKLEDYLKLLSRYFPQEIQYAAETERAVWEDLKYFPVPRNKSEEAMDVSYENSWMFARSFGGERGHEGTDVMASVNERGRYPIVSMTDGIVEKVGWLKLGGYRIGIRSPGGGYFYYAHLYDYAKDFKEGDEIKAGELLGFMGDSGYGEEGTTGQFAVHLHVGIYVPGADGQEMSLNPYWILKWLEPQRTYFKEQQAMQDDGPGQTYAGGMGMRLDKYLADMGIGTRSEVKQQIRKKQVLVNGSLPQGANQQVFPGKDEILFQGREVAYQEYEYFMLNKPMGCVSAVTDRQHQTVLELITEKTRKGLFPVGRLDRDTEGLLLITNDGGLSHNLLSPYRHVPKTYFARVRGNVGEEDIAQFAKGLDIGEEKRTLPARLRTLSHDGDFSEIELTIMEGKFHQVKRMFTAVGKEVVYLKRLSMGGLELDSSLQPGEYRRLTEEEIALLRQAKENERLC